MTAEAKLSTVPPYRWVPGVFLTADDAKAVISVLPQGHELATALRDALAVGKALATYRDAIETNGVAK